MMWIADIEKRHCSGVTAASAAVRALATSFTVEPDTR
jgi:hypothetical protein